MPVNRMGGPETVLVLAPTYNDAAVAIEVLEGVGIKAQRCDTLDSLCECLERDWGAVIISEESLTHKDLSHFQGQLESQPPWSDIPVILLASYDIPGAAEFFSKSANISLLERPFSRVTLTKAVEVALRARRKQYYIRDLLAALKGSKEDAERANNSKTQFLANMSHEIRTPIGAILGFIDLMKNPANSPEENRDYMGIVERNSKQLLRLIDDILDLSKVEAGKMTVENVEFSLTEMLADFISVMSFKAAEKGIDFQFHLDSLIPQIILSDPLRLKQILTNIVGNALKFTERGRVEFRVEFADPFLKFTTKDTGPGISDEQKERLFKPFSQADTSTTRKFGGTGLGLVLSRRLAESLGGKLDLLETKESQGSTFFTEIRSPLLSHAKLVGRDELTILVKNPIFEKGDQVLKGVKILLVEDSPDNQVLISTFLRKRGATVMSAADGQQGVDLALKEEFDVVLMDIQMPVLDGIQAMRKLKTLDYPKPVIALTAHAMKEQQEQCLQAGFTKFLSKPIQWESLITLLSESTPGLHIKYQ